MQWSIIHSLLSSQIWSGYDNKLSNFKAIFYEGSVTLCFRLCSLNLLRFRIYFDEHSWNWNTIHVSGLKADCVDSLLEFEYQRTVLIFPFLLSLHFPPDLIKSASSLLTHAGQSTRGTPADSSWLQLTPATTDQRKCKKKWKCENEIFCEEE